ncbi:hypothetical protein BH10PLA2_BH10PLA2_34280 [soil metagenome]
MRTGASCILLGWILAAGAVSAEHANSSESAQTSSAKAQSPSKPGSTAPQQAAKTIVVPASPGNGFNFPYLLRIPTTLLSGSSTVLLVEPNNSGRTSDNLDVHLRAAKDLAEKAVGADLSRRLQVPLLVPVFPRPKDLYTHILNRRTLETNKEGLRRLDLQLLAMIRDAKQQLKAQGIVIADRFLMTGFSASGAFVNRFTLLHPDKVLAVAAGATNGMLMLPSGQLGSDKLSFPLGVDDIQVFTNRPFQLEAWKKVPQFIYLGANDTNDAVKFDDAYTNEERALIYRHLGQKMQPDRWEKCQQLYLDAKANVEFRTFKGFAHNTSGTIHAEIAKFFQSAMATSPK